MSERTQCWRCSQHIINHPITPGTHKMSLVFDPSCDRSSCEVSAAPQKVDHFWVNTDTTELPVTAAGRSLHQTPSEFEDVASGHFSVSSPSSAPAAAMCCLNAPLTATHRETDVGRPVIPRWDIHLAPTSRLHTPPPCVFMCVCDKLQPGGSLLSSYLPDRRGPCVAAAPSEGGLFLEVSIRPPPHLLVVRATTDRRAVSMSLKSNWENICCPPFFLRIMFVIISNRRSIRRV